jgi:hypothetical protein
MPVILANWDTEIGGLQFEAIPGKKFMRPLLNQCLGTVVHTCHLICAGG